MPRFAPSTLGSDHTETGPGAGQRRIMIGTDTYPPDVNGAGYFTYRLATGLAARGNEVHVVCVSDTGPARTEIVDGVTLHRLRSHPVLLYPDLRFVLPGGAAAAVRRIYQRVRPDVTHIQSHFAVGRACLRASRQAGVPVAVTNHFMPEPLLRHAPVPQAVRDWAATRAWNDAVRFFRRADLVTTPTPLAAKVLADNGFDGEVEAISCGIDLDRFRPDPDGASAARAELGIPDRRTILFVGRLDREKRIDQLVRAVPALRRRQDVQLVVAGVGTQHDNLTALAADLGVSSYVHLLGFVPDEQLPRVYHAGDVFAIASVAELQSIVTLEAMASGLPVVGADAVALPHLVRNGYNGYLFTPGDVEGIGARIDVILSNPADRSDMSRASRELAAVHSHDASLRRFEAGYDMLSGATARSLA